MSSTYLTTLSFPPKLNAVASFRINALRRAHWMIWNEYVLTFTVTYCSDMILMPCLLEARALPVDFVWYLTHISDPIRGYYCNAEEGRGYNELGLSCVLRWVPRKAFYNKRPGDSRYMPRVRRTGSRILITVIVLYLRIASASTFSEN